MYKNSKKCRLCRREREKLFLKGLRCLSPKCPLDRKGAVPPGDHGIRSGVRPSAYAKQLREKQKVKRFYGVSELQLKNYFLKSVAQKGETGLFLMRFLELRLDNVVFRLGWTPSRSTARQLIVHGHVLVNGRKMRTPSYQVRSKDKIIFSEKAQNLNHVQVWVAKKENKTPSWLKEKSFTGQTVSPPSRDDLPTELNDQLVVGFYKR